ncbi:hypothetical protein CFOL_v3_30614 [Cephalotus follicularis]|uniref:Uncharacterized protein n=1 Tax=Cephalotus follicularis TaxID=3775 RepID=A0A1Q3D4J2_CEPFO|nr:hypothetical protein CFOL_v3_30614 [Cephalotus follicularis]
MKKKLEKRKIIADQSSQSTAPTAPGASGSATAASSRSVVGALRFAAGVSRSIVAGGGANGAAAAGGANGAAVVSRSVVAGGGVMGAHAGRGLGFAVGGPDGASVSVLAGNIRTTSTQARTASISNMG